MTQNDERRPARNAAAIYTTADDTNHPGAWIRCPDCGARCPGADHLVVHRVGRCVGAGWKAMRLIPRRHS